MQLDPNQQKEVELTLQKLDTVKRDIESAYAMSRAGQIDAGCMLTIQELALRELMPLMPKAVAAA